MRAPPPSPARPPREAPTHQGRGHSTDMKSQQRLPRAGGGGGRGTQALRDGVGRCSAMLGAARYRLSVPHASAAASRSEPRARRRAALNSPGGRGPNLAPPTLLTSTFS